MKDALKYAKEALKLDPHNFDAEALVLELKAKDGTRLVRDYAKAVQRATAFMEETGCKDVEVPHYGIPDPACDRQQVYQEQEDR